MVNHREHNHGKTDWGALQITSSSPSMLNPVYPHKDWCEAQGLNYATARRSIKKPTAQVRKNAQKKMRTGRQKRRKL